MQWAGSQADSAIKPLRLGHVPSIPIFCRSNWRKDARVLAQRAGVAKLVPGKRDKKTGMGMNADTPARSILQKPISNRLFRACACCAPSFDLANDLPNKARRNFLAGGIAALGLA